MKLKAAPAPTRFRAPVAKGIERSESAVDREARTVNGYAVISRGPALGHGLWIDKEMLAAVVAAGNASPTGLKCRFTHPGLCSDGLGKFLGRAKGFRLDGDCVRADLHLCKSASKTPNGDLAEYVMDLAEEDPGAFGTSIVFERDPTAESKFLMDNGGTVERDGWVSTENFVSPDADNTDHMPHARLATLQASDVVDEPAANAGGFFGRADEIPARAESVLSYALKLTDAAPDALATGGMDPLRVREFFDGFMSRHNLRLERIPMTKLEEEKKDEKEEEMAEGEDEKKEECAADDKKDEAMSAKPATVEQLRAAFGKRDNFILAQLEKGHTLAQAHAEFNSLRIAELEDSIKKLSANQGAAPASFNGVPTPATAGGKSFIELAREHKAKNGGTIEAAMSACATLYPDAYKAQDPNFDAKQYQKKNAGSAFQRA